jgi:hypothetical protein
MSLAESVALHLRHPAAPPGPGEADGARAPASLRGPEAAVPEAPGEGATGLAWLAEGSGAAAPGWLVSPTSARPAGGAGYAAAKASTARTSTAKAPAGPRITGEWSFLSDPSLSVEEKLARFMIAAQKKLDDDLTRRMEEYRAKYGEGGTEAKKDDGGGILGSILKAVFPPLAIADAIFGDLDGFLTDALKALGGPLLAALATAVGMPTLAPGALKVGDALAEALTGGSAKAKKTTTAKKADDGAKAGGTGKAPSKKPTTTKEGTAKKEAGTPDERLEMLEIQRLVEKQNQLFTLVSNVMKGMHDTAMVAVQNVR